MGMVRFDEIAKECRNTYKGSFVNVPIVGLEHIEPYDMLLHNSDINVETTFTKSFKKGQILFGRRRAYQHKACVATFEGVCSGDITVIEPIERKVHPDLLPFIVQNDDFFEHAIKGSNGALSPRVKWEHMANFEVNLPSLAEQKVLAEKLWAAYEVKQSYLKMIEATQEMVKSQFIEMFGSPATNNKGWFLTEMKAVCTYISDGSHYSPPDDNNSLIPMLSVKDMTNDGFTYSDCKHLSSSEYQKLCANGCKPLKDDVLVAKDGSFFKYIFPLKEEIDQAILSSIAILRPNTSILSPRFLCEYLKSKEVIDIVERHYLTGTAIHRVILRGFRDINIFLPPLELQKNFEEIYYQSEKAISELRKSIDAIDKVIKSLINENL